MFAASFITLAIWIYWLNSHEDNEWNFENKVRLAEKFKWYEELTLEDYQDNKLESCLGNNINYKYKPCFQYNASTESYFSPTCMQYCEKIYDSCTVSFMVWSTPLIISIVLLFFSFICAFLNPESSASAPSTFGKIFIMLLFGLWCTASLSGAGAGEYLNASAANSHTVSNAVHQYILLRNSLRLLQVSPSPSRASSWAQASALV